MKCTVVRSAEHRLTPESCLVVPVFEGGDVHFGSLVDEATRTALHALLDRKRISPKAQSIYFLATPAATCAGVLVLGLGKREAFNAETLRRAAGKACDSLRAQRIARVVFDSTGPDPLPDEALIEGIVLGQYDYAAYKAKPDEPPTTVNEICIVVEDGAAIDELADGCARALTTCLNANWARDLACMPPNDLVPAALAARAQALGAELGVETTVIDADEMRRLGMNAILAVARGSSKPPKLIRMRYTHPEARETIALVGKGITFDTGGISLKPGLKMHEMKYDMCGAAAVLAAFKSIAEIGAPINVVCVVPAAENKPGADAQRPGDIIRAYNGKTIEVHNTDAEGRLVLADALAYTAEQDAPAAMVDIATLTGAVIVSLGHFAAGMMGNNAELMAELQLAADATGERVWPLPLWDDYAEQIKGTHADLCNIGPPGVGGSITAACFLKEFVGDIPWAHLDIAGTAWGVEGIPYWNAKHATGFGARLLTQYVLHRAAINH